MKFTNLNIGYNPRPHPAAAIWTGSTIFLAVAMLTIIALFAITPVHVEGVPLGIRELLKKSSWADAEPQFVVRLVLGATSGMIAGLAAFHRAFQLTPLSEPFRQVTEADPCVYYGEYARNRLKQRLFEEAGTGAPEGLYLAPHLVMPRSCETKSILVVGEPNSGKSNIIRALADQSIERGDSVLLLCNKGDVTSSFAPDEAVLIAAHHRDSYAVDLAADVDDVAGAQQFAADIVPESSPPFWSDSARSVLTDIILKLQELHAGRWTAHTLLRAVMSDSEVIRRAIDGIVLNAGPLIEGGSDDGENKTAQGILTTMRSAAIANLRPLAWAWHHASPEHRFSVKRWLSNGYVGPRTVIVQYSSDYTSMSSLVAGSLIRRIAKRIADPQLAVDANRRVAMVLDEFHLLGKIDDIGKALAVGREKGLFLVVGIQGYSQLIDTYGEDGANKLLDLFAIKIFGRLSPGATSDRVVKQLGERTISALVENRTPGKDDKRLHVEERKTIPTFSPKELAFRLGVFVNPTQTGNVKAVVHCYGQVYVLEWPFTIWRRKRPGFVPALWLSRPPRRKRKR